jgi:hypothetical protein
MGDMDLQWVFERIANRARKEARARGKTQYLTEIQEICKNAVSLLSAQESADKPSAGSRDDERYTIEALGPFGRAQFLAAKEGTDV